MKKEFNTSLKKTPIAIVGLSAIFADAINVEEFWTNIMQLKDSIIDVPSSRWNLEDYYDPDLTVPDKTYCKRGGFLPEIDFNPMEFGLPPNILEVTDVSQLLSLVAARDAFADAGYGYESSKFTKELKEKTGVILGVGGGQKLINPLVSRLQAPIWEKALRSSGISDSDIPPIIKKIKKAYVGWNENSFPGVLGNVISGRITNRFDLGGINSVVDAACAASLSAIKMAVSELLEGRCDMMLTGGVDTDNSPFMYMSFSKTPAFSKSGHITPFDNDADGMLIGEGIGMLVLKRLSDAEKNGDRIYGIIKGIGGSSDGKFKSIYAPRSSGQVLAMNRAYQDAGYPPSSVNLIETHGTGTEMGDPTEFTSMQNVFGTNNLSKNSIAIGSVKSQIGHTKTTAGAAGMIKTVLALYHKVLPATINVIEPNRKFNIKDSALYINTETRPWFRNNSPRRAGVSAFGFGGINLHVSLEEYDKDLSFKDRMHEPYKLILIKGSDASSLIDNCNSLLTKLNSNEAISEYYQIKQDSKNIKIVETDARLGFVSESLNDCIEKIELALLQLKTNIEVWEHPKGIYYSSKSIAKTDKVVALFSGQGSQYVGMAGAIVNSFPEMHQTIAKFNARTKEKLSDLIYPIPCFNVEDKKKQEITLTNTENAQPSIGSISLGMYKTLQNAGFKADLLGGHSFGELTALYAAGVISEDDYITLAIVRGKAMAKNSKQKDTGTMLAVNASLTDIEPVIGKTNGVTIANINSEQQVVLGGETLFVNKAKEALEEKGIQSVLLPVSAAFHTSCVEHAQKPFAAVVQKTKFKKPNIPIYSNTTTKPYPLVEEKIKNILENHILHPVNFKEQVEKMFNDGGRIFVEFGPKPILTNLVKDILQNKEHHAIALNPNSKKNSDLQFRQAVVQLRVLGLSIANIDPYTRETKPAPLSKMNIKLSGNSYVSEATKKSYQDELNNGFQITPKVITKTKIETKIILDPPEKKSTALITKNQDFIEDEIMKKEIIGTIKDALILIKEQQNRSLEIYERMLTEQNKQTNALIEMLGKQLDQAPVQTSPVENIPRKKDEATEIITKETVEFPKPEINNETTTLQVQEKKSPVIQTHSPQPEILKITEQTINVDSLKNDMLQVVSEKTGYPQEMLELNMDMEADLGIDSIKRVEIFGAITEKNPALSGIDPVELTELRTLQEIVGYVGKKKGVLANVSQNGSKKTIEKTTEPEPTIEKNTESSDDDMIGLLLNVISEKTGYPQEMLELNMDMEADLGIDSIKRVEIFGAITERNPGLSGIDPTELTELRTLQEIVSYTSNRLKKKVIQ